MRLAAQNPWDIHICHVDIVQAVREKVVIFTCRPSARDFSDQDGRPSAREFAVPFLSPRCVLRVPSWRAHASLSHRQPSRTSHRRICPPYAGGHLCLFFFLSANQVRPLEREKHKQEEVILRLFSATLMRTSRLASSWPSRERALRSASASAKSTYAIPRGRSSLSRVRRTDPSPARGHPFCTMQKMRDGFSRMGTEEDNLQEIKSGWGSEGR